MSQLPENPLELLDDSACLYRARIQLMPVLERFCLAPLDEEAVDGLHRWIEEIYPPARDALRRLRIAAPGVGAPGGRGPLGIVRPATPSRAEFLDSPGILDGPGPDHSDAGLPR